MKKYSDKFLNQAFKLKNAKIGFEFEFYMKDISYYKTLELLNNYLSPVKVWGFRQYHSGFEVDENNFKIEPDLSGGSNMVELITGPLSYYDSKYYLIKIIKFIQDYGYTSEKCSIHFNISFSDEQLNLNDMNILKFILNTDEEEIYREYPSRKGNVYAKSIKNIIPFKEYDFYNIPVDVVKNNMRLPNDKYYGVNFLHINDNKNTQRIEFRYIGGKDYEKNLGQLIYFMDKFIISLYDSIDVDFNDSDIDTLQKHLQKSIKNYKSLSNYDNFIVENPTIQIQVDQVGNYDIIKTYYNKIYNKIYNIIDSTDNLKECILNYVTKTQTMEIVDAQVRTTSIIKDIEFINCEIEGIFENCFMVGCEIRDTQMIKCKINNSDVYKSKVLSCSVDNSLLQDCYFMEGYLNGDMRGGVYRSGKLGPYASLDSEVKVVGDFDNFFNTKFDIEGEKGDDKGYIKGFKK
jgi:hypothetical protein